MSKSFSVRVKPLAAAVGLAMAAPFFVSTAFAAAPGNVPVNGTVVQGSVSYSIGNNTVDSLGSGVTATLSVSLGSTANVIDWGNPNTAATINPSSTLAGFNIGTGSSVNFTTGVSGGAVVLNIDDSGQLSTLNGSLTGTDVNVFVANQNGIVVGSAAVLTAPVLGLIASNVSNTALTNSSTPTIALSFATAGSISIANGAKLNAGSTTEAVLIAGAGTVNVAGTSLDAISTNLVIDGGVSGLYDSNTGTFGATTSVGNVNLTTAPTNVDLNLGTSGTQFTLSAVYADGNITNAGDVILAASPQFTGTFTNNGYVSNDGAAPLDIGGADTSSSEIYVNTSTPAPFGSVVNNGTISAASGFNVNIGGTFTNTSNGQVNVTSAAAFTDGGFTNNGIVNTSQSASPGYGDFSNNGGAFVNTGTMSINGTFGVLNGTSFNNSGKIDVAAVGATADGKAGIVSVIGNAVNTGSVTFGSTSVLPVNVSFSDANFSNTGTMSLITATNGVSNFTVSSSQSGTLAGSFSATNLQNFSFAAGTAGPSGTTPGNIAEINTQAIAAKNVTLAGYNVTLDSSVGGSTNTNVTVGGAPSPVLGTLTVAKGATLGNIAGTTAVTALTPGFANVALDGDIAGNTVSLGQADYSLNNIQGPGSILSGTVDIYATGNVNNPNGGGAPSNMYLKNGLLINPGANGTATVTVGADGPIAQYWNLKVLGNAVYQSVTNNFATTGLNNGSANGTWSHGFYSPAPNASSHLIMQAAGGNLTINGTDRSGLGTSTGFLFPGLIMAVSSGDMTVVGNLNNGYGASVAPGSGIMLNAGGKLAINGNIYTNGNSLVNFWAPGGVTLAGSLYNVYQPSNTSTNVDSFANTPYLYGSYPGASSTAGGARNISLYHFVNGY